MAKDRPSLTSLSDRLARKVSQPSADPAPASPPPPSVDTPVKSDTRVQVMVRMTAPERKALRQIALEQDTTVQRLIEDAIRDVLRRHGR